MCEYSRTHAFDNVAASCFYPFMLSQFGHLVSNLKLVDGAFNQRKLHLLSLEIDLQHSRLEESYLF